MSAEPDQTPQEPCAWCLVGGALLLCRCTYDCGEPDCVASETRRETTQPVPQFLDILHALVDLGKPVETPGPVDLPMDANKALRRVLDLHQRCECKACSAGFPNRVVCRSCQAFWPCPTILVVSDKPNPVASFDDGAITFD